MNAITSQNEVTQGIADAEVHRRTRLKICGVRDVATAEAAVAAGADLIGLVFVQASPRCVTPEAARRIVDALPIGVEAVGLFADHTVAEVQDTAAAAGVSVVQLHGREGPGFAKRLAGLRVIKAVGFEPGHMAEKLRPWREARTPMRAMLIDAPPASDAPLTGGAGVVFDWDQLAEELAGQSSRPLPPIYLAGGLTAENVGQAVRRLRPFGVDVSSGVESSRGIKDPTMIAAFGRALQQADLELATQATSSRS